MSVKIFDATPISSREITPEGFLVAKAKITRPGLYDYYVGDFPTEALPNGLKNAPYDQKIVILKPDDEVLSKENLDSIAGAVVTDGHPSEFIDSRNVSYLQRGRIRDNVRVVRGDVAADVVIQDSELIQEVQSGLKTELSTGSRADIDWQGGTDPKYGDYDAVMSNIRSNHVAVVYKGRAGAAYKIQDEKSKKVKGEIKMATRIFKGLTVEVTDQGAQVIDTLSEEKTALETENESLKSENEKLGVEVKDAKSENEKLKGKIAALETEIKDADKIDDLVAKRTELIDSVRTLHPEIEVKGKDSDILKREAIVFVNDSISLEGKSSEFVDGIFETMLLNAPNRAFEQSKNDVSKSYANVNDADKSPAQSARERLLERNRESWKA